MKKFTDSVKESIQTQPKFIDKTKQNLYSILKETVKINDLDDKILQVDDDSELDELTDKLYNFLQNEKLEEKISTLESIKTILVSGPFNFKNLNEQIEQLKKNRK